MSTVCRCCLVKGNSMKNLFSYLIEGNNSATEFYLADAYNLSTNLNLRKDSKQPMDICVNCEEKLIAAYKFRIQCREANTVLSKLHASEFSEFEDNSWDDEFLYNVPMLSKGYFFKVKSSEITFQFTYEINPVEMDFFEQNSTKDRKSNLEINDSNEVTDDVKKSNFTCTKCDKPFVVHSFYRVHCEKFHSSDWECEYCDERFTAKTYGDHKRLHTNRPLHECYRCNTIYMSKTYLNRHRCPVPDPHFESSELSYTEIESVGETPESECDKKFFFKCTKCQEQFSVHSLYRVHCEKFHNSNWECEHCDERFTGQTYQAHKQIHRKSVHECHRCHKMFMAKHSMINHRCIVPVIELVDVKEEQLDSSSDVDNSEQKKIHKEKLVKRETIIKLEVEAIGKPTFTGESLLDSSSDNSEQFVRVRKYPCEVCNDEFTTKTKYLAHKKTHKPSHKPEEKKPKRKNYLCNYCGKNCKTYNSWVGHVRIHTGEKPYTCDFCGKNFRQTTSLRNHRQLHTGKKVKCELCPKTFASTGFLAVHMRSHNNERNFKCEICDKSYLMKHALAEHNRVKHKLVRYSCSYCDNSFTSSGERKIHETIHTGKRWWCPLCTYKATTRNTLKGHISNVHKLNIDDLNIEPMETGFELKVQEK